MYVRLARLACVYVAGVHLGSAYLGDVYFGGDYLRGRFTPICEVHAYRIDACEMHRP